MRNPNSTRPWQHVLEPLRGYLSLASKLDQENELSGKSFNFGPSDLTTKSVLDLVKKMSDYWPKVKWDIKKEAVEFHESGLLKLNCDLAHEILNWQPKLNFEETIKMTAMWYNNYYENKELNLRELTIGQIKKYTEYL